MKVAQAMAMPVAKPSMGSIETLGLDRQITRLHFVVDQIVDGDSGKPRVCE